MAVLSLSRAPHVVFLWFPPTLTLSGIYLASGQIMDIAILSSPQLTLKKPTVSFSYLQPLPLTTAQMQ
jgi:hypothetical protein